MLLVTKTQGKLIQVCKIPEGSLRAACTFFSGPMCREVVVRSHGENRGKRNSPKPQGERRTRMGNLEDLGLEWQDPPRNFLGLQFPPIAYILASCPYVTTSASTFHRQGSHTLKPGAMGALACSAQQGGRWGWEMWLWSWGSERMVARSRFVLLNSGIRATILPHHKFNRLLWADLEIFPTAWNNVCTGKCSTCSPAK